MEWLGLQPVKNYGEFSTRDIKLNHALVIVNTSLRDIGVYVAEDSCFGCPYSLQHDLEKETDWQVDTSIATTWRIMKMENYKYANSKSLSGLVCELRPLLGEFGVYRLNVGTCELREELSSVNTYLPLLLCLATLITFGCLKIFIKFLYKYFKRFNTKNGVQQCEEKIISKPQSTKKFLYVFRGILLSSIIFLTTGAGGYSTFTKENGGISLAGIAFSALLWSVGFKIPLSVQKIIENNERKSVFFKSIAKKSAALIIVGFTIDSTLSRCQQKTFPIWWPLQKIGIAYFISTCVYVCTSKKYDTKAKSFCSKIVANFMPLVWCWIIGSFLMAALFIVLTTVWSQNYQSASDFAAANFVRRSNEIEDVANIKINYFPRYMNNLLLAKDYYVSLDQYYGLNSGLIGILVGCLYSLIGLQAGMVSLIHKDLGNRVKLWCFWGIFFVAAGLMLVGVSLVVVFNLWPLSTILIISGTTFFGISAIFSFVEIFQINFIFTRPIGQSFLLLLCGHILFTDSVPFTVELDFNNHLFYLLKNVWILVIWYVLAVFLCKSGVRISI